MDTKLLFLAAVVLSIICTSASAQFSERYRYLVEAGNRISEATGQSAAPDRETLLRVTADGCKALTQLLDDRLFRDELSKLAEVQDKSKKARATMKRELDLFVASFLRVEEQWLRDAGLDERNIKEILWAASFFRDSLDATFNPHQILQSIHDLRVEMCNGVRTLQALKEDAERMATVRKLGFRVGGVLLMAVDAASPFIVGPVAGLAIATGSVSIGAEITDWGAEP